MTESIIKADIPDLDQWEEMELVEDIGTPDEHADTFYRWENFGIEVHDDGLCQAYVIVNTEADGEVPIMVVSGLPSPDAVIEYFRAQHGKEVVPAEGETAEEGGSPVEGSEPPVEEVAEVSVETTPVPEAAPGDEPNEKLADDAEPEGKSQDKKDSKKDDDKVDENDKKKDEKVEKSAVEKCGDIASAHPIKENDGEGEKKKSPDAASARATPMPEPNRSEGTKKEGPVVKSIRDMLNDNEMAKSRGLPNGHVTRCAKTIDRSNSINKSGYMGYGYKGTQIGAGRDAVGHFSGKTPSSTTNGDGVSVKPVHGGHVSKSEDDMSFASMMKRRMIAKGYDRELPNSMDGEGSFMGGGPEGLGDLGGSDVGDGYMGPDGDVAGFPAEGDSMLPPIEGGSDPGVGGDMSSVDDGAISGEGGDEEVISALAGLGPDVLGKLATMTGDQLVGVVAQASQAASEGGTPEESGALPEDLGEEVEPPVDEEVDPGAAATDSVPPVPEEKKAARGPYSDRRFGTPIV